jgi:hypothetical protein
VKEAIYAVMHYDQLPWARILYTALKFLTLGLIGLIENIIQFVFLVRLFGPALGVSILAMAVCAPVCKKIVFDNYALNDTLITIDVPLLDKFKRLARKQSSPAFRIAVALVKIALLVVRLLKTLIKIALWISLWAIVPLGILAVFSTGFSVWMQLLISAAIITGVALLSGLMRKLTARVDQAAARHIEYKLAGVINMANSMITR